MLIERGPAKLREHIDRPRPQALFMNNDGRQGYRVGAGSVIQISDGPHLASRWPGGRRDDHVHWPAVDAATPTSATRWKTTKSSVGARAAWRR